jgi:carbamate kinase
VDVFIIATEVEGVALHYGKSEEKFLRTLTYDEASSYLEQGHFPAGSILIGKIEEAVQETAGTEIVP